MNYDTELHCQRDGNFDSKVSTAKYMEGQISQNNRNGQNSLRVIQLFDDFKLNWPGCQ